MLHKLSTTVLAITFIGLLALVIILKFIQSAKSENTFSAELVSLDSASLNKIEMIPAFREAEGMTVFKENGKWTVQSGNEKFDASEKTVTQAFRDIFLRLEASRLVTRSKDQWSAYEVDSAGTMVKFYENGELADELIIGKLTFQNENVANYYVRKPGETSVYAVEAYLDASLKAPLEKWKKGSEGNPPGVIQQPGQNIVPPQRQ